MPHRLALEVRGLTIRNFDHGQGEKVFDSLSLDVVDGESFGWLALAPFPSHAFIECLAGARFYDQGSISVFGTPIEKSPDHAQRFLGFVPEENLLDMDLPLEVHLKLFGDYFYLDRSHVVDRIYQLARAFGLEGVLDSKCRDLNELEKKRAALTRALLHSPQILIVEEPLRGLHGSQREEMKMSLFQARELVRTFVVLTSEHRSLEGLFDRIGLFEKGQLRILGNPALLSERYLGPQVAELSIQTAEKEYFIAKLSEKGIETLVGEKSILVSLSGRNRDLVIAEIANGSQFSVRPVGLADLLTYVTIRGPQA